MLVAETRLFRSGQAKTLFLTFPSKIVNDSAFPFKEDDLLVVILKENRVIIRKKRPEDKVR